MKGSTGYPIITQSYASVNTRSAVTAVLVLFSRVNIHMQLQTVVGWDVSLLLMLIGLFGFIFCGKLYALIQLHAERSYGYLNELDTEVGSVDIDKIKKMADHKNRKSFPFFNRIKLNKVWSIFHLAISVCGLLNFLSASGMIKFV